jgi:hypothetical protein
MSWLSIQCAILNISQPCRPPRPVTGIALLYFYRPLNPALCSFSYFEWTVAIVIVALFLQWPLQKLNCWLWMIRQIGTCGWESLSWRIPLKQIWLSCKYIHVYSSELCSQVSCHREGHEEIINPFHFGNQAKRCLKTCIDIWAILFPPNCAS